MRRLARGIAFRVLERAARALGFTLVWRDFWGPTPNLEQLPRDLWEEPNPLRGLRFDADRQLDYLREELATFIPEFDPPRRDGDSAAFFLDNGTYGRVDAEILYAMVRRHRPRRVLELGCGASTIVISAARERNAVDGHQSSHVAFDPYPGRVAVFSERSVAGAAELRPIAATEIPVSEFERLEANDILFVDTTHTVKTGGDVNYIVLDVLPALQPGVIVHFHDIFLPWEYPRDWLETFLFYWAEQYLVHAFLAFNAAFEVLISSHALVRRFPDEVAQLIPSFAEVRDRGNATTEPPRTGGPDRDVPHPHSIRGMRERVRRPRLPLFTPAAFWLRRTEES